MERTRQRPLLKGRLFPRPELPENVAIEHAGEHYVESPSPPLLAAPPAQQETVEGKEYCSLQKPRNKAISLLYSNIWHPMRNGAETD